MTIREETIRDYRQTENLVREAFWNVYKPGCDEHYVLHKMRDDECFLPRLSLVGEQDGQIVAQIAYAKCFVTDDNGTRREAALFGPVSVLPACQGRGYGGQIIRHTLQMARAMGFCAVLITGNPAYYARFGFVSASRHGIYYEGLDRGEEAPFFMVKILDSVKAQSLRGVYADPAVYRQPPDDVEAFDALFPPKTKEKRPGQLF